MQFMISMKFTDQGIRTIKDAPKRTKAARELAKKLGIEGLQEVVWVFWATSEGWKHACEHLEPQIFKVAAVATMMNKAITFE